MKDFACCGVIHPTLHELLQHYEENHVEQAPPTRQKQVPTASKVRADPKAAIATGAVDAVRNQGQTQQQQQQAKSSKQGRVSPQRSSTPLTPRRAEPPPQVTRGFAPKIEQEDDAMGDMEMEDDYLSIQPPQYPAQNQARITQRSQFGQPATNRVPNLDINTMNMGNPLQQHQGLRNSQPTTPVSASRNGNIYYNNPTVSSVNTPTLTTYPNAHPLQQQYYTPDSSAPGTPGELDGDFIGNLGNMNMGNMQFVQNQNQNQGFGGYDYSNDNSMGDYCIDEPAKRLFSLNGGFNQPQQPAPSKSATQLGDGQYSENSELAKTIREQQKLAGVPDPPTDGGLPKPFHCPVIGCEKAYKNQNGLKYHKSVSVPCPLPTLTSTDSCSTATIPKPSKTTTTAPSPSSIPRPLTRILAPWAWKSTSRTAATPAGNATRTSTASSTTRITLQTATRRFRTRILIRQPDSTRRTCQTMTTWSCREA